MQLRLLVAYALILGLVAGLAFVLARVRARRRQPGRTRIDLFGDE